MIKRLIFDIDNTLIEWKNEYWNKLKEVFDELNINYSKEIANNIIMAINTYEDSNEYYNKQKMLEHINKITGCNFNMNFLNGILKKFESCVPSEDEEVISTLEYLSKKYELVVLTNWFKSLQEERLKKFGILHFFNNVFAGENFKMKPHKESFDIAMENRLPDECIMVGDNFKNDVQGAIDLGMQAIYINPKLLEEKKEKYIIINNIIELKEIL